MQYQALTDLLARLLRVSCDAHGGTPGVASAGLAARESKPPCRRRRCQLCASSRDSAGCRSSTGSDRDCLTQERSRRPAI